MWNDCSLLVWTETNMWQVLVCFKRVLGGFQGFSEEQFTNLKIAKGFFQRAL